MSDFAPPKPRKKWFAVAVETLQRLEIPDYYVILGLFLLFCGLWSLYSWAVSAVVVGSLLTLLGIAPQIISLILEVRGAQTSV